MKTYLKNNKEYKIGRHYIHIGYDFTYLYLNLSISRWGIDLGIYPLSIGIEFYGVDLDNQLSNILSAKK